MMQTPSDQARPSLFHDKYIFALLLALIFGLGLGVRFVDLSAPLLDFQPTRQLFSAIKARGLYYQSLPNAPAWQRDISSRQLESEATIEPPLMEHLAAFFYGYFGEQTAIPRAFSVLFWAIGGIFLFLLACNLTGSSPGAAAALAFYLFLPYALRASRAFQPDPLMLMLIIAFWWAVENWGRNPSWKWSLLAGLLGGLAIFVKFPAAFFIVGGALGAIFAYPGLGKALRLPQTWGMAVLGAVPGGAYLYYGLYIGRFLGQQFEDRFFPALLTSSNFYLRWFLRVDLVVSVFWLALAVLAWLLFAARPLRVFLLALFLTYIVYGLVFDFHIASHDYYSLPLIPLVGLALAPLVADGATRLSEKLQASRTLLAGVCLVLIGTFAALTAKEYLDLRMNDFRAQAAFWAQVGAAIGHQPRVVSIITDYGYPLEYYGWQNNNPWPLAADITNYKSTFAQQASNKYFFLITDFDEYDRQPGLQSFLSTNYPVFAQGEGYLVFDLLHPLKPAVP